MITPVVPMSSSIIVKTVKEFSAMSGLASAKIRRFLSSGFIEGFRDSKGAWHVKRDQLSKFIRK